MHPTEPSRAEALDAMTPEKLEEMARPAPRASHSGLRDFLEIPYDQLEEMNLEAKEERLARRPADEVREQRMRYLTDEKRIKAVTVCFTDLEGRLHMLDYDKKFLLKSADNLTFDGSSIRGFSQQQESDLRLAIDWPAFYWLPSDVFGPGKVLVFGEVLERDGSPYSADMRAVLKAYTDKLYAKDGTVAHAANEIEGFLFQGPRRRARTTTRPAASSSSPPAATTTRCPATRCGSFIDTAAEVQRAHGLREREGPPRGGALAVRDELQLHRGARSPPTRCSSTSCSAARSRRSMDMTACFLPKPVTGVNGNGMHTNMSMPAQAARTSSTTRTARTASRPPAGTSSTASWPAPTTSAWCSTRASTPTAGSIRTSRRRTRSRPRPIDRGSMVRIPLGNERSARVEVRSIAPDANPYMAIYTAAADRARRPADARRTGTSGRARASCRTTSTTRSGCSRASQFMQRAAGRGGARQVRRAQARLRPSAAPRRSARCIKAAEVQFHHEVTNQYLWTQF